MPVLSLDCKDLLEEEMGTHSSILTWKIPWAEEPGRLYHGTAELDTTEHLYIYKIYTYLISCFKRLWINVQKYSCVIIYVLKF